MDKNNVERLQVSVADNDDAIASMVKAHNDTIRSMVRAYYNGDENLDQFPDSAAAYLNILTDVYYISY